MPLVPVNDVSVEYVDTGGPGPVVVLLHGVHMDAELWSEVIAELRPNYRCVAPTLPLGAHRHPIPEGTDLTLGGLAAMLADFLDVLGLREATLVGNDTGGAILQVLASARPELVARLGLVSCEAFDNLPPGLPGRADRFAASMPGGVWLSAQSMRVPGFSRLPMTFGRMSKRPIPKHLLKAWFEPLRKNKKTRSDFARLVRLLDPDELEAATRGLDGFNGRAAVIWAAEDKVMPTQHGHDLGTLLGVEVALVTDSYTLVPLDQPKALAQHISNLLQLQ